VTGSRAARRSSGRPSAASSQEAFITIWLLGLCVALLFLGGISLDLWRAFSTRRALASIADAAAVAGASGIDRARFDSANELVLDPGLARSLALDSFRSQNRGTVGDEPRIDVTPDRITVTVTGKIDYTLLRILLVRSTSNGGFTITVDATAAPYRSS
jgi:Flp pilus assembly protein TadG